MCNIEKLGMGLGIGMGMGLGMGMGMRLNVFCCIQRNVHLDNHMVCSLLQGYGSNGYALRIEGLKKVRELASVWNTSFQHNSHKLDIMIPPTPYSIPSLV